MRNFTIHKPETAPEASRSLLEEATSRYGFIPNLLGVLAEAPQALEAYVDLSELLARSSLSAAEREVVLIAASLKNSCGYCVAAHSTVARRQKVPGEVIAALRESRPISDPRLEALRRFAETLIETRGQVSEQEVQTFLNAGFSRRQMLEVVLGLALKTLSNYTNNLVGTPVDDAFAAETQGLRKAG